MSPVPMKPVPMSRLSQCFGSAKPKLPGIGHWAGNSRFHGPMLRFIEFIDVRRELFRPRGGDETIRGRDETIFRLWCRTPETAEGYQAANQQRRVAPAAKSGDRQMRTLSFLLPFFFVLAAPSVARSVPGSPPGTRPLHYCGGPSPRD